VAETLVREARFAIEPEPVGPLRDFLSLPGEPAKGLSGFVTFAGDVGRFRGDAVAASLWLRKGQGEEAICAMVREALGSLEFKAGEESPFGRAFRLGSVESVLFFAATAVDGTNPEVAGFLRGAAIILRTAEGAKDLGLVLGEVEKAAMDLGVIRANDPTTSSLMNPTLREGWSWAALDDLVSTARVEEPAGRRVEVPAWAPERSRPGRRERQLLDKAVKHLSYRLDIGLNELLRCRNPQERRRILDQLLWETSLTRWIGGGFGDNDWKSLEDCSREVGLAAVRRTTELIREGKPGVEHEEHLKQLAEQTGGHHLGPVNWLATAARFDVCSAKASARFLEHLFEPVERQRALEEWQLSLGPRPAASPIYGSAANVAHYNWLNRNETTFSLKEAFRRLGKKLEGTEARLSSPEL
jgi:hypothetical protein